MGRYGFDDTDFDADGWVEAEFGASRLKRAGRRNRKTS
jgi:hypothetical protein